MTSAGPRASPATVEDRATPLELFFDLVFVFTLTQVTVLMSDEPTWAGLGEGILVLAALWWAWSAYAWLTNEIDTDDTLDRLALFASMAAFLIAALAAPQAMEDDALIFGLAYLGVRLLHVLLFAVASRDVDAAEAMRRLWATAIPAPLLLVAAGLVDQGTTRTLLWILALAIDFSGPYIRGVEGFRVSAAYFAERYALIIIIALGESIVAVGAGLAGDELDAGVLLAAALGMVIAACFWWAYFDVVAVVAERRFKAAPRAEQNRIARDSYSYLHLPMIAGIVLVALGVKKTLGDVGEPLKTIPAVALCAGVTAYFLGHVGFRLRNVGSLNRQRLAAAIGALALIPVVKEVDAVVGLGLIAALTTTLTAYEAIHFREARARIRAAEAD